MLENTRTMSTASTSASTLQDESSPTTQVKLKRVNPVSRIQKFSLKWLTDPKLQNWIEACDPCDGEDNTYAKCKVCLVKLKAKYSDLVYHSKSNKHQIAERNIKFSKKIDSMMKTNLAQNREHVDVVLANLRSSLLVAEHNLSFNVVDHITEVSKINFKDSKVANYLQLGRTKCTMIIKNVLADVIKNELKQQVKDKYVSILLDEASDVSNKKILCILVKFIQGNEVRTQVLGMKEVDSDHGTAKGLYSLLKQSLEEFEIEQKNVVGYCADNASVMMGKKESVKQYLLNSNQFLISNGCICHSIHLVAVSAAACLPDHLENLLQNISTYFSRSPKRQSVLESFQEFMQNEKLKILKPSATRWLALHKCIERILNMWDVLIELFRLADFERESEVAQVIFNQLCNPVNKAYLLFLNYILPLFNQFNAFFQSKKSLTPTIYSECLRFLKTLGSNFLKKEYITDEIIYINCYHPHHLLPLECIQAGPATSDLIKTFDNKVKNQFLLKCVTFYQKAFENCLSRFPLNNFFLKFKFC